MIDVDSNEHKVLVLTPIGKDAEIVREILGQSSISTEICDDVRSLIEHLAQPYGAILIAEEVLDQGTITSLNSTLKTQQPWSDIPLVLLTTQGEPTEAGVRIWNTFAASGNVTILERPVRTSTLVSAIQVALRARRRQYQVRKLLEEQKTATLLRDEFISIASHELKTPITAISLQLQLKERMLDQGRESLSVEKQKDFLQKTRRQVTRLQRLIDDMLDVSRIHAGKFSIRKEEFDLAELIQEVFDRFEAQLAAAGCKASLSLYSCQGSWDRYRIEQVITNLITNAIRYAPGASLYVRLGVHESGIELIFEDDGPGIAEENLEKIFERFERGANSGPSAITGLGLGLYICRQIMEAHQGSIRAEKRGGRGARFVMELPRPELSKQSVVQTNISSNLEAR